MIIVVDTAQWCCRDMIEDGAGGDPVLCGVGMDGDAVGREAALAAGWRAGMRCG